MPIDPKKAKEIVDKYLDEVENNAGAVRGLNGKVKKKSAKRIVKVLKTQNKKLKKQIKEDESDTK